MNVVNYDENALLLRLKNSDGQAFTELYNQFWKPLFVVASNKINNLPEAEEIVQEIFLDIWNRRENLQINNSISCYLFACVKYKVISALAKRNQALRYQQFASRTSELDFSTENWLRFEELKDQFLKESGKLPEKCKLVFQLSRNKGLTQKQIALQLGISEKTVESHLSRALRILRVSLGQFLTLLF